MRVMFDFLQHYSLSTVPKSNSFIIMVIISILKSILTHMKIQILTYVFYTLMYMKNHKKQQIWRTKHTKWRSYDKAWSDAMVVGDWLLLQNTTYGLPKELLQWFLLCIWLDTLKASSQQKPERMWLLIKTLTTAKRTPNFIECLTAGRKKTILEPIFIFPSYPLRHQ